MTSTRVPVDFPEARAIARSAYQDHIAHALCRGCAQCAVLHARMLSTEARMQELRPVNTVGAA